MEEVTEDKVKLMITEAIHSCSCERHDEIKQMMELLHSINAIVTNGLKERMLLVESHLDKIEEKFSKFLWFIIGTLCTSLTGLVLTILKMVLK